MRVLWRSQHHRRCLNWLWFDYFKALSTTPCWSGAMISALRGKKLKEVRPSNPFPRNPQRFPNALSYLCWCWWSSPPESNHTLQQKWHTNTQTHLNNSLCVCQMKRWVWSHRSKGSAGASTNPPHSRQSWKTPLTSTTHDWWKKVPLITMISYDPTN